MQVTGQTHQRHRQGSATAFTQTQTEVEYDSLWLQQGELGAAHIFVRDGRKLEIFQALDASAY